MGSRLTPRQFVSISLAQLAPSIPAASSNFIVSADADDQAVTRTMDNIDRIGLMVSSAPLSGSGAQGHASGERRRQQRREYATDRQVFHRVIGALLALAVDEDPAFAGRGIVPGREPDPRSPTIRAPGRHRSGAG